MIKQLCVGILLFLVASFPMRASDDVERDSSHKIVAPKPVDNSVNTAALNSATIENEAKLYKELYEITLSKHESFISDLKWMISIITSVFLGLFGTQLFLSNRINKKEIDNIRSSLEISFNRLKSEIQEKHSMFKVGQDEKLSQISDESRKEIKNDVFSNVNERFNDFQLSYNERLLELDKSLGENKEVIIYRLNNVEQYVWEMRGVKSNQLSTLIDILNFEKTTSTDLSYLLSKIFSLLDSMNDLHLKEKIKLESELNTISGHKELIAQIKLKAEGLPLYEMVKDQKGDTHFIHHKK